MSCSFEKEKLTGYYDGELDPVERNEVERHISSCSECLRDLGEIKSAALWVRGLPRYPAPPSVARGLARAVAASGPVARFRALRGTLLWATAAAAVLLIVVNVVFFANLQRRSPDSGKAGGARDSAVPGLAWKGGPPAAEREVPPAPASGAAAAGKEADRRAAERPEGGPFPPPAVESLGGPPSRRAAAGEAQLSGGGKGPDAANALKGRAAGPAAPPAPAAPPPRAAQPSADRILRVEERRKSSVKEELADPTRQDHLRIGAAEAGSAEKRFAGARGVAEAGEKKEGRPLALTLAASDPGGARSRVEAFLKKIGAVPEEPRRRSGGESEGKRFRSPMDGAPSLPASREAASLEPLTVNLTARQLAALREEIQKDKSVRLVRKPGARLEAADRLSMDSKSDAPSGRTSPPAEPLPRERAQAALTQDKQEQPEQAARKEPEAPEADEFSVAAEGEPVPYRLTIEFILWESPPEGGKR